MAVNPPRRRRATNVDAVPAVPVYETEAIKFVTANKEKNKAASVEKTAKEQCHIAMKAANVGSFQFMVGNTAYGAEISGGDGKEVSILKLYALVEDKTITMQDFLKVIGATQGDVKTVLGKDVLASVTVNVAKTADLKIKPKKGEG